MSKPFMTKAEATRIRSRQLNGGKVRAVALQEAIWTLSKRRDRKVVLPKLPPDVRAMVNAALCFNLGRACKA